MSNIGIIFIGQVRLECNMTVVVVTTDDSLKGRANPRFDCV